MTTKPKPFRKGEWIRLRRMDDETRGLPNWHRAVADPVPSNLYESGWYYQPRRGQERWCAGFWRRLSAKEMRAEAKRRQGDAESLRMAAYEVEKAKVKR